MSHSLKAFIFLSIYLIGYFSPVSFNQLSAYVSVPRSGADTTDRMNFGGDPPDRPGLRDLQRSPEYLDDVWGKKDYNPYAIRPNPNVPNTFYEPETKYYDYNTRNYRPGVPK